MPDKDISLTIRSVGLTNGGSFVLGESVRLDGIVGHVENIQKTQEGYIVEVRRRITTLSEAPKHEITLVQLQNRIILWVAAGYLYTDSEGSVEKSGEISEEE